MTPFRTSQRVFRSRKWRTLRRRMRVGLHSQQWTLLSRRQFYRNHVPRLYIAALDDNRHDASLADKATFRIPPEDRRRQARRKCVDLPARIAQTSHLDGSHGSEPNSRTRWQSKKIEAARRNILAHGAWP